MCMVDSGIAGIETTLSCFLTTKRQDVERIRGQSPVFSSHFVCPRASVARGFMAWVGRETVSK